MERLMALYEKIFTRGFFLLFVPIILITLIETINVIGRKLIAPLPCALEAVESLMVVCAYFAVSLVAAEGGHVNVTLMTRKLPPSVQNSLDAFSNLFGMFIFGIWAWGAWLESINALRVMEMRMGVFRFPIWPFKIFLAMGLTMLTIQLFFNAVKLTSATFRIRSSSQK